MGIVPFWAKDPKAISTPFNARSEEAYAKPMFRGPFRTKRCLVPATAFFEWQVVPGQKKQKIRIARADGDLVRSPDSTTLGTAATKQSSLHDPDHSPNAIMEPIHNRMPVILVQDDEDEWLILPRASIPRGP